MGEATGKRLPEMKLVSAPAAALGRPQPSAVAATTTPIGEFLLIHSTAVNCIEDCRQADNGLLVGILEQR